MRYSALKAAQSLKDIAAKDSDGTDATDAISPDSSEGHGEKKTVSQLLVELAEEFSSEFFHDPDQNAYADVIVHSHRETWAIHSRGFRLWLSGIYFHSTKKAPSAQALQDALGVLSGKALFEGPSRSVHVRVAGQLGNFYLDLADKSWQAIKVSRGSWSVIAEPSVRFRRTRGTYPIPIPTRGGSLDDLRSIINIGSDADWGLAVVWLTHAFTPKGPYCVLALHGEQGVAKSTTARVFKRLLDPNKADLRAEPREMRDLAVAADGSWLIAFDNLSSLPRWLSDALCRLSTGGGFATRELYSDRDETLFDATRPIILTGIGELATSGDLLDRSLVITLAPIAENDRLEESEYWSRFEKLRPGILGALLDAVSTALKILPDVRPKGFPRMADFARWGHAIERVLKWPERSFEAAYARNREEATSLTLDASPIGEALPTFLRDNDKWSGTAAKLLQELETVVAVGTSRSRAWPKSPNWLSVTLRRLSPAFRQIGIEIDFARKGPSGERLIHIRCIRRREDGGGICVICVIPSVA